MTPPDLLTPTLTSAEKDAYLAQIPTETTVDERRLLLDFFEHRWDGSGTVVEIGPFLGGTTRAIAWGMLRNARLDPRAALHTFDRFGAYYSAEMLRQTIQPMVQNGIFTAARADDLCRVADFERLFQAIHVTEDYSRLIHLHNSPLPDLPREIERSRALDCLNEAGELSALFIDGCKSWASTHYAMKYLLPRTRVGSAVIFQDFGWYTCFWISSVAYALRDCLQLEARADATYLYRLTRPITAGEVAMRFERTPDQMGEAFFRDAAAYLFELSERTGDLRGELIAQLHHVAALATLNRKNTAAQLLQRLNVRRYAPWAGMMRGCIASPTYLPGGKQIFWKDAA